MFSFQRIRIRNNRNLPEQPTKASTLDAFRLQASRLKRPLVREIPSSDVSVFRLRRFSAEDLIAVRVTAESGDDLALHRKVNGTWGLIGDEEA